MKVINSNISQNFTSTHYSQQDIDDIKEAIKPFEYTKRDLIADPKKFGFTVANEGDTFILRNFHNDPNSNMGICEELTYKASKKLNKRFKGKLIFFQASNYLKEYNMGHVSLRAVPESQKGVLIKLFKLAEQRQKLLDKLDLYEGTAHQYAYRQKLVQVVNEAGKLLEDCLFVDPSFKIVSPIAQMPEPDYSSIMLGSPQQRRKVNPYTKNRTQFIKPIPGEVKDIPLGFAKDLLPEIKGFSDDTFLTIGFTKIGRSFPCTVLGLLQKEGYGVLEEYNLSAKNPLCSFLSHIRRCLR